MANNHTDQRFGKPLVKFEIVNPLMLFFLKGITYIQSGVDYFVVIYPILSNVRGEDCLRFMKSQNAVLRTRRGVNNFLDFDVYKDKLPRWIWINYFDAKDVLDTDEKGEPQVPELMLYGNNQITRSMKGFNNTVFSDRDALFCVCMKTKKK